jgi:hypothetical protein
MFWPPDLSKREAELSVIPKLLETQEAFISVLSVDVPSIDALFNVVSATRLPANLFLKQLVVLADFGGEMLQRVNGQFKSLFPTGRLRYLWDSETREYTFSDLPVRGVLNNDKLGISGKSLLDERPLSGLLKDVVALVVLGGASEDEHVAEVLCKCEISNFIGKPHDLSKFVKQRYIMVSRITGGSKANALGQIAQKFVEDYLKENLASDGITVSPSGRLPGVSHADKKSGRPTAFDLVAARGDRRAAVEVTFQVTTNSTIERKSGQARARYEQVDKLGYKIAYVIDGAGNFQRENAIRTLCSYSHCTVAFSRDELGVLVEFLRGYLCPNRSGSGHR